MRHKRRLSILATLALAVAACGGDGIATPTTAGPAEGAAATSSAPEDGTPATPTDGSTVACATILSDDEMQSILGVPTTAIDERTYPGSATCEWKYTGAEATNEDFFQVLVEANGDEFGLWTSMKDSEAESDVKEPIPVAGIGDESFTWVGQGDYRKLYVRRGDRTLIIRAPSRLPVLSTESTMIDLADRLFGRF